MPERIANNPSVDPEQLAGLHDDLWRWVQSHTANRDTTDDVVQTVYVMILEGRARFAMRSSLKTWLFGVAYNVLRNDRRRRARWVLKPVAELDQPVEPPSALAGRDLRAALSKLPMRQREILSLNLLREFTLEECAQVLGITIGSVRTHYHRAKKALHNHLGPSHE